MWVPPIQRVGSCTASSADAVVSQLCGLLALSALKHPWKHTSVWRHEYHGEKMLHDTKGNVKCNGDLVLQQLHGKNPLISFVYTVATFSFQKRE